MARRKADGRMTLAELRELLDVEAPFPARPPGIGDGDYYERHYAPVARRRRAIAARHGFAALDMLRARFDS